MCLFFQNQYKPNEALFELWHTGLINIGSFACLLVRLSAGYLNPDERTSMKFSGETGLEPGTVDSVSMVTGNRDYMWHKKKKKDLIANPKGMLKGSENQCNLCASDRNYVLCVTANW